MFVGCANMLPGMIAAMLVTGAPAAAADPVAPLPLRQNGGTWASGYVQGIALVVLRPA